MATFTITTPVNIDSLSGKTGNDTYNINGGFLTIDQDSRYGVNNSTSSTMGSVSPSATLGGTVTIDARNVKLLPYNLGMGLVPAMGATIIQGSAQGICIGVYSALNAAPATPGGAMPATGWIKIKQWNGNNFAAGGLSLGAMATLTGPQINGWLEIVGTEGPTNWSFNRLNNPTTPLTQGDWYNIGTTGGARTDTYQIPSNGVNQYHGGVWVQGASSVSVTAATYSTSRKRVTITTAGHSFETGDKVTISGITPTGYNTTTHVRRISATQFSYYVELNPGTYTSGGAAVGEYEFYPSTSETMVSTNISTTALKGKWCKIDTAGVLRFGHDGTNSSGGYLPPSGRNIRIGNVFMTGATSGAPTQNSYNAAPASRPRFILSGAGRLDVAYASMNWGFGSVTTPQLLRMQHTCIIDGMSINNPATQAILNNFGVGSTVATAVTRIAVQTLPTGALLTDVTVGVSGQGTTANINAISFTDAVDITMLRCKFMYSSPRGATTQLPINFSRTARVSMLNCIEAAGIQASSTSTVSILGGFMFDSNGGNNLVANAIYAFTTTTSCLNWLVEGIWIENGDLSRNGLLNAGSSSANLTFRNMGSVTAPIGTGLYEEENSAYSRTTTVLTVTTSSAHGLTTGDTINVYRTDNPSSFARGNFTIASTPTSTTFTIAVTNAGATSGVLSYFTTQMARMFILANNDNVKFQNLHMVGIRTALYGLDNSCTNIYLENVTSDWRHDASILPWANNTRMHGTSFTPISSSAGSSVYGTHTRSGFVAETTVPNATTAAWTRTGTTATITKTDHGLVTASRIQVQDATNAAAFTPQTSNITVLTKDTFTITCLNTGTTSGTLDYTTSDGIISVDANENNTLSAGQYNIVSGTPLFTGAGALAMFTVGDEVYWQTERYITDFVSAENMLPQMSGGTIANHDIHYDIDTGSGFSGVWKNYFYQRAGGGGTISTTNVTMTSTTGVAVGDYVYGIGIATGAKVQSITNATTIVVTIANTAAVSGILYFNQSPNITAIPSTGFKFRVKVKTITANTSAITFLRGFFRSNSTTRAVLYPQAVQTYRFSLTNIPSGSTVAIYDSSNTQLFRDNNVIAGFVNYDYVHSGTDTTGNYAVVWHTDYYPLKYTGLTFSTANQSIYVVPVTDRAYIASSVDISTFDWANKVHVMDPVVSSGGYVDVPLRQLYSNWKDEIKLSNNFIYDFAYRVVGGDPTFGTQSVSLFFYQINSWKMRPKEINHTATLSGGVLIPQSGGAINPTVGSYNAFIDYQKPEHAITISLAGALTPSDIAALADGVWDEQLSGHLTAGSAGKVQKESGLTNVLAKDKLS